MLDISNRPVFENVIENEDDEYADARRVFSLLLIIFDSLNLLETMNFPRSFIIDELEYFIERLQMYESVNSLE